MGVAHHLILQIPNPEFRIFTNFKNKIEQTRLILIGLNTREHLIPVKFFCNLVKLEIRETIILVTGSSNQFQNYESWFFTFFKTCFG